MNNQAPWFSVLLVPKPVLSRLDTEQELLQDVLLGTDTIVQYVQLQCCSILFHDVFNQIVVNLTTTVLDELRLLC